MEAEFEVTAELVRSLLHEQHPDLSELEVTPLAHGWDNELFRLGDDLLLRFPRRSVAAPLIEIEQRWLPVLAPTLPLPVPAPVRIGRPGCGYPWAWSVLPWLDGQSALHAPFDQHQVADDLAAFLNAMHRVAPPDAPLNAFRGVPLQNRNEVVVERIALVADRFDTDALARSWGESLAAQRFTAPAQLLHGDVHPGNLLVSGGRLSAVIDFGDLCAGDPATDFGVAWMLFDNDVRTYFLAAVGAGHDMWLRARGWALTIALAIAVTPGPTPLSAMAEQTIANVLRS